MSITPVNRPTVGSGKRLNVAFMLSNAFGIVLYLTLASRGWRMPQEHGMVPVTGEPFVWAIALPVLGIFFLADIVWGGLLLRFSEPKRWLWWIINCGLWLLAICVDFTHH